MRKIYSKPKLRVKALKPRPLLQQASNVTWTWGATGKLDSKACSYYFDEDDFDDEY